MQNLLNPWYFTIIRAPKDGQVKARSYIVVMMSQSESFDIVIHILLFMLLGPTYIHIWFIILNKFCLQETQLVFPCSKSSIEISENFWNLSKVNNKNTWRMSITLFWCPYCKLWRDHLNSENKKDLSTCWYIFGG